jgi:hypothetical protein
MDRPAHDVRAWALCMKGWLLGPLALGSFARTTPVVEGIAIMRQRDECKATRDHAGVERDF